MSKLAGLSLVTDTIMGRKLNSNERLQVRNGKGKLQTELAKKLCQLINWNPTTTNGFTIENIKSCENVLDMQVCIRFINYSLFLSPVSICAAYLWIYYFI